MQVVSKETFGAIIVALVMFGVLFGFLSSFSDGRDRRWIPRDSMKSAVLSMDRTAARMGGVALGSEVLDYSGTALYYLDVAERGRFEEAALSSAPEGVDLSVSWNESAFLMSVRMEVGEVEATRMLSEGSVSSVRRISSYVLSMWLSFMGAFTCGMLFRVVLETLKARRRASVS